MRSGMGSMVPGYVQGGTRVPPDHPKEAGEGSCIQNAYRRLPCLTPLLVSRTMLAIQLIRIYATRRAEAFARRSSRGAGGAIGGSFGVRSCGTVSCQSVGAGRVG